MIFISSFTCLHYLPRQVTDLSFGSLESHAKAWCKLPTDHINLPIRIQRNQCNSLGGTSTSYETTDNLCLFLPAQWTCSMEISCGQVQPLVCRTNQTSAWLCLIKCYLQGQSGQGGWSAIAESLPVCYFYTCRII